MKCLYFIRHGESEGNVSGVFSGRMDIDLTDKGIKEAKQAGAAAHEQGLHFDLIIASPFKRAQDTARFVAEAVGYPAEQIETHELLLERDFGSLEGTSMETYLNEHSYEEIDGVEGAEPLEQLQLRALAMLDYCNLLDSENILLVGHAAFGRALRRAVEGKPFTAEYTDPFKQIPNAQIIKLL